MIDKVEVVCTVDIRVVDEDVDIAIDSKQRSLPLTAFIYL